MLDVDSSQLREFRYIQHTSMVHFPLNDSLDSHNASGGSNLSSHNDHNDSEWRGSGVISEGAMAGLIVLYSLTIVLSVLGNVLVITVFVRGRQCRTDIRPFLINLAVADLIMALFCMPFTFTFVMLGTWIFTKPMCPFVLVMQHLSVSASVFTNMAISADRLLVVVFPLHSRVMTARAKYVLTAIWTCAVALSSVQWVVGRANEWPDGAVTCDEDWGSQRARRTFTLLMLVVTYVVPLSIVALAYGVVGKVLWTRAPPGNAHHVRDTQQLQAKRKVVKMLVLVVLMFGVCWLPLHTFFLVLDFQPDLMAYNTLEEERFFVGLYYSVHWLAMANSFVNPIIYSFSNDTFRTDLVYVFQEALSFCNCLKRLSPRGKSSLSLRDLGSSTRLRTTKSASGANGSGVTDQTRSRRTVPRRQHDRNRMYIELKKNSAAANKKPPAAQSGDADLSSGRSRLKATSSITFV